MAIYHLHVRNISRRRGQSAVAAAAYRAGEKLHDEHTGETKDYSRREGVLWTGIYAPKDAPDWAHDRGALWNHVEAAEKRKDARLARELEIALPHELTLEQNRYALQDFIRENFTRKGYAADVAIHAPSHDGDNRNLHAHLLIAHRQLEPDGFAKVKARDQDLREAVEAWRQSWEHHANRHLERHGFNERIDCRTLEAQGIEREAGEHLGPAATEMLRRGQSSDRADMQAQIKARNTERDELKRAAAIIDLELEREKRREADRKAQEAEEEQERRKQAAEGAAPSFDRTARAAYRATVEQEKDARAQRRAVPAPSLTPGSEGQGAALGYLRARERFRQEREAERWRPLHPDGQAPPQEATRQDQATDKAARAAEKERRHQEAVARAKERQLAELADREQAHERGQDRGRERRRER